MEGTLVFLSIIFMILHVKALQPAFEVVKVTEFE